MVPNGQHLYVQLSLESLSFSLSIIHLQIPKSVLIIILVFQFQKREKIRGSCERTEFLRHKNNKISFLRKSSSGCSVEGVTAERLLQTEATPAESSTLLFLHRTAAVSVRGRSQPGLYPEQLILGWCKRRGSSFSD